MNNSIPTMANNSQQLCPDDSTQQRHDSASSGSSSTSITTTQTKRFLVSRVQYPINTVDDSNQVDEQIQYPEDGKLGEQQSVTVAVGQRPKLVLNNNNTTVKEPVEDDVTFRYTWPVRITERLIGAGESAILNVSPAFCTAYNGVQFTWLLRICEEDILDLGDDDDDSDLCSSSNFASSPGEDDEDEFGGRQCGKKVNITLYYKEGPARDVKLRGGNICIRNSDGVLFDQMSLRDLEYTKGGGWSPMCDDDARSVAEQRKFSQFIHDHIGKQITVRVQLKMPAALFQPMQYLPSIDSPLSGKLEALCARILDEIRSNQLPVPDVQYFDLKTDKYALYRHVYQFACQEIFDRFMKMPENDAGTDEHELMEKISNIFAHYYFNTVIVREAECFEDFLEALDASRHVQFPALRRECERYICAEVMAESADLALVKKMLLLAERFNLSVLKMVSFGVIVDRLLLQPEAGGPLRNKNCAGFSLTKAGNRVNKRAHESCATIDSMEEIREELLEIAEQIIHPMDHAGHQPCSSSSSSQQQLNSSHFLPNPSVHRKHSKSLCSGRNSPRNLSSSDSSAEEGDDEDDGEEDEDNPGGETLVGSVITQLEELARHIRKVSMPPGVSPAPTPTGRPISPEGSHPCVAGASNSPGICSTDSGTGSLMDSRRSSLKTTREYLQSHRRVPPARSDSGSGASAGGCSFFTQIYQRLPEETQSSSECVQAEAAGTVRDRTHSSNIESTMMGRKNVQFAHASGRRAKGRHGQVGGTFGSASRIGGVRFDHQEADEDEGVELDDQ